MANPKRIIFTLPEETTLTKTIFGILKNNGLEETLDEYFNKSIKGGESRLIIIRDAALVLAQKKVSEEKLAELLARHLEVSIEVTKKIVDEINQKLIPYAKEVKDDTEQTGATENNTSTQKIILEKIQKNLLEKKLQQKPKEEPLPPGVKKPGNTNVEQNAKLMEKKSIPIVDQDLVENKGEKKVITVIEKKEEPNPLDTYREPVE